SCPAWLASLHPRRQNIAVPLEVVPEPDGVAVRSCTQIGDEIGIAYPLPLADLGGVRLDGAVMASAEHVHHLILDQAAGHRRVVLKNEQRLDVARKAHF